MKSSPNRIAALSGAAASVAAVLLAILGAVDSTPKALVVVAAILGIALVVVVFLLGSQKWEELVFRDARGTPDQTVQVTTDQTTTLPLNPATGDISQTGPRSDPPTPASTQGPDEDLDSPDATNSSVPVATLTKAPNASAAAHSNLGD